MTTPSAFDTICFNNTKSGVKTLSTSEANFKTLINRKVSDYTKFKPAAPKNKDFTISKFQVVGGNVVLYSYTQGDKNFSIVVSVPDNGKPKAVVLVNELGFTNHEKHDDLFAVFETLRGEKDVFLACSEMLFHMAKNTYHYEHHGQANQGSPNPYEACYKDVADRLFSSLTPRDMQKATSGASIPSHLFLAKEWGEDCVNIMFECLLTAAFCSPTFYDKYSVVAKILKSHGVNLDEDAMVVECRDASECVWGIGAKSDDILRDLEVKLKAGESVDPTEVVKAIILEKKACNNFGTAATAILAAISKTDDFSDFCTQAEAYILAFEVVEAASPKRKLDDMDAMSVDSPRSFAPPDSYPSRTMSQAAE